MIVLDTNVASETMKPTADGNVLRWLDSRSAESMFLTTVTIAELSFGIGALPVGQRKERLTVAFEGLQKLFESRLLDFDRAAARRYGELAVAARRTGRGFPIPDGYIAAIASARGFAVASRDSTAFVAAGVKLFDPWQPTSE